MNLKTATLDDAWGLFNAGQRDAAIKICQQVLEREPLNAEASHRLGLIAATSSEWELARQHLRDAVICQPTNALYFFNLGNACSRSDRQHEAEAAFRNAVRLDEQQPEYWYNLGNCLLAQERFGDAEECYQQALRWRPGYAKAWVNSASALRSLGRWADAEHALRRAIELDPKYVTAHNNLGNLLRETGRPQEAIPLLRESIQQAGDNPRLWNNLGSALRETWQLTEALAAYRHAVALKPDHAEAHLNLSMALLAAGDYATGWQEYEWRWRVPGTVPAGDFRFSSPRWQGEALPQARVLLHAEQGLGDALQFVRYVPLAAERVGHVVLECPPELHSLFSRLPGNITVCSRGEALPPFDFQCPFLSLPLALGMNAPDDVAIKIPYLNADPTRVQVWANRLPSPAHTKRVGLVWAGNPRLHDPSAHLIDRRRSLRLEMLRPLLEHEEITFFSLQKGEARQELAAWSGRVIDLGEELQNFDDTASLVSNLDLVICVDTSVAHLVGALGKPVWMLSRFDACWRWGEIGQHTHWYPSMRIYRQEIYGDWTLPLQRLADDLAAWQRA